MSNNNGIDSTSIESINPQNILESFIKECLCINTNNPLQQAIYQTRYALNQSLYLRGIKSSFDEVLPDISLHLQKLESSITKEKITHLKIAIVGQFSSGKSSFLNALLGDEILPSGVTPITAKVCEIVYAKNANISQNTQQDFAQNSTQNLSQNLLRHIFVEVHYKDSSIQLKPLTYLHQADNIENATISHFRIYAPIELLQNISFLDTPGFNSQNQIDTDTTNAILGEVDGIIWLSLIDNVGKQSEKDVLLSHLKQYSAKSLCVLNQKDRLKNEEEITTSVHYAKSAFSGLFADIIPISAKEALQAKKSNNADEKQTLWASSNMQSVLDFIHRELRTKTDIIKSNKISRSLESLLIKEAFNAHRSLRYKTTLLQKLQTKAALMRFKANQSDLSARFETIFPQLNSKLDSLAQYIFNAQVNKQIPHNITRKNALGLTKSHTKEKTITILPKDTLKSELTKSENTFLRELRKIGFVIQDFANAFRDFLLEEQEEFEASLEELKTHIMPYELPQGAGQDYLDFSAQSNPQNDFINFQSFIASIAKDYALLQEKILATLHTELSTLKNILILEYQNAIELTLESLDNKMTYALKKHLESPSEFEPFHLTLENVREYLNQGLHFLLFQDKLLLTNALYKTTLFSLSEALNAECEKKASILQAQIDSALESKKLLLQTRHTLKSNRVTS